jgi:hypothetical protein
MALSEALFFLMLPWEGAWFKVGRGMGGGAVIVRRSDWVGCVDDSECERGVLVRGVCVVEEDVSGVLDRVLLPKGIVGPKNLFWISWSICAEGVGRGVPPLAPAFFSFAARPLA